MVVMLASASFLHKYTRLSAPIQTKTPVISYKTIACFSSYWRTTLEFFYFENDESNMDDFESRSPGYSVLMIVY